MEHWIGFWTALWVGSARISTWLVDWLLGIPTGGTKTKKAKPETGTETAEAEDGGKEPPPKKKAKKPEPTSEEAAGGGVTLRGVCVLLACGFIKGLPCTTVIAGALAAAWLLLALVLGYAADPATPAKAPQPNDSEASTETHSKAPPHPSETLSAEYAAALLHAVHTSGSGVHLTTLSERLQVLFPEAVWRTRDVRSLLARVGVPTKPVRAGATGTVSEGVHKDHFPPLREGAPGVVVAAGQDDNNNANNAEQAAPREGITILKDPGHPTRYDVQHHDRPTV
ncbi:hypothetical protein ACFXCZ_27190 [Streptomyces sp. NPDC059396]|uniref:hypothetical protein n=1 Tax=Streptomyces sp. NPDC059396 TaxID=3346819 RepID=UPI0036747723